MSLVRLRKSHALAFPSTDLTINLNTRAFHFFQRFSIATHLFSLSVWADKRQNFSFLSSPFGCWQRSRRWFCLWLFVEKRPRCHVRHHPKNTKEQRIVHLGQWLVSCHKKFRWEAKEKVSIDRYTFWCLRFMLDGSKARKTIFMVKWRQISLFHQMEASTWPKKLFSSEPSVTSQGEENS